MYAAFQTALPEHLALAARPQLAENSRLGFAPVASTSRWAFSFSISSNTLGLSPSLYDGRVRPRSTGKERDTESGLDYFGARYLTSDLGRFMSPDTDFTLTRILSNPQRWNRYAYVINNPLARFDPDGLTDFYVFLNYTTSSLQTTQVGVAWLANNGLTPNWKAIQAMAPAYGNSVTLYGADGYQTPDLNVASAAHLQYAVQQGQVTITVGDSYLIDAGSGLNQAYGILMGDGTVVGNSELVQSYSGTLVSSSYLGLDTNGGTVADFGCYSGTSGSVFLGANIFLGYGGEANVSKTILAAAQFLTSGVTNQGLPASLNAANSMTPNSIMTYYPTEYPQAERDTSIDDYQITQ